MGKLQGFAHLKKMLLGKPGAQSTYPFGPDTLVFKVGNKMFALLAEDEEPLTMNLKCDPDEALALRDAHPKSIFPGYHMDHHHWNTVVLDGKLPDALVQEMIDQSYELVVAGLSKREKVKLGKAGNRAKHS